MKKLFVLIIPILFLFSCKKSDTDFPDFTFTTGYFPYQFPVRTLVLGDYIYDNSNDNAHKFEVFVGMGGVYENSKDRVFDIQVDNSLANNIAFSAGGNDVKALPQNYYTLASNKVTIPKGKMNGGVEVQLTDAFFSDPNAIKLNYILPLRLVGSSDVDSILVGSSGNAGADIRIASQWDKAPKNFTMYAVKYINEYQGKYFIYGSSTVKNAAGAVTENTTYSEQYVEFNKTVDLITTGRYQVSMKNFFQSKIFKGEMNMILTFNGNNCTVTAAPGSVHTINGTGVFQPKKYSWGNKQRDGIELKYNVSDGVNTYEATEVLVIRDRDIVMEVYSPALK